MSLWDDIQTVAQQKASYNPNLAGVDRGRVNLVASRTNRRPPARVGQLSFGPETRLPRVKTHVPLVQAFSESNRAAKYLNEPAAKTPADEHSGGGGWKSRLGDIFEDVIDVVDTPRAAVVSAGEQLGKALSSDMDASWDEWWADTARNQGTGDIINEYAPDTARWAKLAGGLAGDVALDPLTYLTFGTVKAAGVAGKAASPLDNALVAGSRRELASEVVLQAAKREVADEAVDRLAREAGKRGRGAFTRKGLSRAGVSPDVAKVLGQTTDFGYRFGTRSAGVNIPLTRTLAETSENLKGSLKAAFGGTNSAAKWRNFRITSKLGEKELVDKVLTGAVDSADAARGLASIRLAKASSYAWMDTEAAKVARDIPELGKLSRGELQAITHTIETGNFDGVAAKVKGFYDEIGSHLKKEGVEFEWRDLYVNHILSQKALRALRAGDHRLRVMGLNAEEAFQHGRIMEGTVKEINDQFRDQLGYDLLEDNVAELMSQYLTQAQRSLLRAHATRNLQEMGVVRELDTAVDLSKKDAAVKAAQGEHVEAVAEESRWLQEANKARRANLTDATQVVTGRRKVVAAELQAVEEQYDAAVRRLGDAERALESVSGRLRGLEVAEAHWTAVAKSGRSNTKRKATNKLKAINAEKEALNLKGARLNKSIATLRGPKSMLRPLKQARSALQKQYDEIALQAQELTTAREALDTTPLGSGPAMGEAEMALHNELVRRVRVQFINAEGAVADAANAFVWATVDADTAVSRLNLALSRFDEATEAITGAPPVKGRPLSDVQYRREVRDQLRERTSVVQEVLRTMPDDPRVKAIANIEAQTAAWDMEALQWRVSQKEIEKQIAVLEDPAFIDHMEQVVTDGWTKIGEDLQMPKWMAEAFDTKPRLRNRDDMAGLVRMLDGFNGWWKGWATASPGFVVRNWYSGVFNIWLDRGAGAARSINDFTRYYSKYVGKNGSPEKAAEWATRRYGADGAAKFEQALQAAAGSGWGLTPQEVSSRLVGESRTINPFSTRNYVPGAIRDVSSDVEAILRGAHAYDIIRTGGSVNTAIGQIEKFHFNYRDIIDFDRAAKRIVPFWTFFSRNMALQANVWTHMPHKLNRSYFNIKRNLELQSEPDDTVPSYFEEIGAIRTPIGEPNGGKWYFTPDLPSLRFREDLLGAIGVDDQGFDPLRLLSDAGPLVKTPVELAVNRQLFTGIPFKNRPYDFDENGKPIPREAPSWAQLPGVSQVAGLLPGVQQVGDTMTMQDNTQYALEGLWPLMGRATRLLPNQPKYEERVLQSRLSFAGVPVRQNTEQSIQGELYRQQKLSEKERTDAARRQLLQELGG